MFCSKCGKELLNGYLNFCPSCGNSLAEKITSDTQQRTITKFAKFNLPSESLLQSCIASLNELGITINKIDKVAKYIETIGPTKSAIANYNLFPVLQVRVTDESKTTSLIRIAIFTKTETVAADAFSRLIYAMNNKLNQEPTVLGDEPPNIDNPVAIRTNYISNEKTNTDSQIVRKISIILGIIEGIWTAIFLVAVLDYNFRLEKVSETAFGLGTLIVNRIAPSIEISTIIALLFIIITVLLLVRPTRSRITASLALSIVNILLSLWVVNQIPQLLYSLFVLLCIGIIFSIITIIYSASVYKKII